LEGAIGFAKFRQELETRAFGAQDLEIESLKRSPYFFQRTTLRVLTALARTAQGAQLENVLANANVVIPALWDGLRKPDRWLIGRAYAEVHSEGRTTATSGLRKALLQVKGFDYVPEDLRSRTFLAAASELQSTHFGMNNFYNEPAAIRKLESLGTTIPTPALAECITAILCVKLGNRWGVSWSAQPYADRLLARLTDSRWAYYANECLPGDEVILGKLIDEAIVERWISLAKEYSLHKIEVRDRDLKKLFRKASEIAEIVNAARGILQKLTSERK